MQKSQADKIYDLLKDGIPHRTDEILSKVYGSDHLGIARISARCWDIKKKYGVEIKSFPDKENPALWWYQLKKPSDYLPAINIDEFKTQPLLFELPEVKQQIKIPN